VPTIPSPETLDPNLIFESGAQVATVPMGQQQGDHRQVVGFEYHYFKAISVGLTGPMETGLMPFDVGTAVGNAIPATAWSKDILGPSAAPGNKLPLAGTVQNGLAGLD
jgi:hypothetical protein